MSIFYRSKLRYSATNLIIMLRTQSCRQRAARRFCLLTLDCLARFYFLHILITSSII